MSKVKIFEPDISYIEYLSQKTKLNIKELSNKQGESISFMCYDKSPNKKCLGNKDLKGNCLYGGILRTCNKDSITLDAYNGNGGFIRVSVLLSDIFDVYWYKWTVLLYK